MADIRFILNFANFVLFGITYVISFQLSHFASQISCSWNLEIDGLISLDLSRCSSKSLWPNSAILLGSLPSFEKGTLGKSIFRNPARYPKGDLLQMQATHQSIVYSSLPSILQHFAAGFRLRFQHRRSPQRI
jgi:hypothetical protein